MAGGVRFCPNGHGDYSPEADLCNDCGSRLVQDRAGEVVDGWVLNRLIGLGGTRSSVWEAERGGETAAVKIAETDPEGAEGRRLIRSARLMHGLEHANIVRVLAFGETEADEAYMVMELLRGRTLREVLQQRGVVPLVQALHVVRELLSGLGHVHARGVVHRDVKPGNVHLTARGSEPWEVRLMDFGVAGELAVAPGRIDLAGTAGALGPVVGTPEYMAPEQVLGGRIDGRADLYAAGIVLYRLVTGELPFQGVDRYDLYSQQLRRPPAPPCAPEGQPPLTLSLEATMATALAKQPRDRFANAEAFIAALDTA